MSTYHNVPTNPFSDLQPREEEEGAKRGVRWFKQGKQPPGGYKGKAMCTCCMEWVEVEGSGKAPRSGIVECYECGRAKTPGDPTYTGSGPIYPIGGFGSRD